MRICLVNLDFGAYRSSGLAVMGETLARGLATAGHEVTVVAAGRAGLPAGRVGLPAEALDGGIRILRTRPMRGDWICFAWQAGPLVARLHAQQPFDAIHFIDVHFAYHYRGPYVASLLQSFTQRLTADRGRPAHTNLRQLTTRTVYYRLARAWAERPALRRALHLIATSQATADAFIAEGCPAKRVSVAPIAIPLDHMVRRDSTELRARLALRADERVLLFVGFATARKGLLDLARALPLIAPATRLVLVGRWEPAYRAAFEAALGAQRERALLMGYVPDDELPAYYSLADVFVLPSLLEGFGIPVIEALACGTPAVVTYGSGATAETAGPGALAVPPGDPPTLAQAINRLLADEPLRQRLAREGQAWARAHFSIERMVAEYVAIYERYRGPLSHSRTEARQV